MKNKEKEKNKIKNLSKKEEKSLEKNKEPNKKQRLKQAVFKAGKGLYKALPLLLGTILLVSLFSLIPKSFYASIFQKNAFLDSIIGTIVGSVSAGNPLSSYVLGGELLNQGIGLIAVTAFLVAWITVGIVQLPAEAMMLGKKFAISRNILSFIFAIIIGIVTFLILKLFGV